MTPHTHRNEREHSSNAALAALAGLCLLVACGGSGGAGMGTGDEPMSGTQAARGGTTTGGSSGVAPRARHSRRCA